MLRVYLEPATLRMLSLGFSAGLPLVPGVPGLPGVAAAAALPTEVIGTPSEFLLLKNMFDPNGEVRGQAWMNQWGWSRFSST